MYYTRNFGPNFLAFESKGKCSEALTLFLLTYHRMPQTVSPSAPYARKLSEAVLDPLGNFTSQPTNSRSYFPPLSTLFHSFLLPVGRSDALA